MSKLSVRLRSFIASWIVLLGVAAVLIASKGDAAAEDKVLKHFSNGNSRDSVGMITGREDAPPDGPQAIYASDDGNLYVLDQVNGRVLRLDPKNPGAPAQSLQLPDEMQPTDLVVRRGSVYVWDGAPQALQATGPSDGPVRSLTRTRSAEQPDDVTMSAFAQMGSQVLDSPEQFRNERMRGVTTTKPPARQIVASRGRGNVTADVTINSKSDGARVDVRQQSSNDLVASLNLQVRDRIGIVEFLEIDSSGRMFVLTENIPNNSRRPSAAFVVRFSPQGVQESVYDIPISDTVALSRRSVAVSADGEVYFLRSGKTDVDLIGVGSRPIRANAVIDNPNLPRFVQEPSPVKGPTAAVRPLNREQVIETAFAFEGLQWHLTPSVYGRDPDTSCSGFNRVRRPWYLAGKMNQDVRGVPYCWGCHGSLNQFRANIANGMLAGNVCTHNDPRPDVAGVDCSAFVSAAWGLSTHFTTAAIPSITTELQNAWDLQPGDALNKPGSHVMLFLRFTPDRKAEVMEASTGGCNGRVCRNIYPLSSLLARGYRPVRFRALQDSHMAEAAVPDVKSPDVSPANADIKIPERKSRRRERAEEPEKSSSMKTAKRSGRHHHGRQRRAVNGGGGDEW